MDGAHRAPVDEQRRIVVGGGAHEGVQHVDDAAAGGEAGLEPLRHAAHATSAQNALAGGVDDCLGGAAEAADEVVGKPGQREDHILRSASSSTGAALGVECE
jgi:hypothetical protein